MTADLSSLTADQLAENVRDPHKPDGCAWCRVVDETFRRLKTAEDALKAERHRAVEAESRLISAIRSNPKP